MKTIFYNQSASFELTDEEFNLALIEFDKGKRIYLKRLGVSLSPLYIWAGEKPQDNNKRVLHDGSVAIKKFGTWVDEKDNSVVYNLKYYPELSKDTNEIKKIK